MIMVLLDKYSSSAPDGVIEACCIFQYLNFTNFSCSLSSAVHLVYIVEFINKLCSLNDLNNQETDSIKHIKGGGKKKQNMLFPLHKTLHVLFNDKCLFELNVIQPVINMSLFPSHMANFP